MLLCGLGWLLVRQRLVVLRRSYEELVRNLGWIKKILERNRTQISSIDNSQRTMT
jgi:hypothetical protein